MQRLPPGHDPVVRTVRHPPAESEKSRQGLEPRPAPGARFEKSRSNPVQRPPTPGSPEPNDAEPGCAPNPCPRRNGTRARTRNATKRESTRTTSARAGRRLSTDIQNRSVGDIQAWATQIATICRIRAALRPSPRRHTLQDARFENPRSNPVHLPPVPGPCRAARHRCRIPAKPRPARQPGSHARPDRKGSSAGQDATLCNACHRALVPVVRTAGRNGSATFGNHRHAPTADTRHAPTTETAIPHFRG